MNTSKVKFLNKINFYTLFNQMFSNIRPPLNSFSIQQIYYSSEHTQEMMFMH